MIETDNVFYVASFKKLGGGFSAELGTGLSW